MSVDNRTRALVKGLQGITDAKLLTTRVEEFSCHLLEFPETRVVAIKVRVCLLILILDGGRYIFDICDIWDNSHMLESKLMRIKKKKSILDLMIPCLCVCYCDL